MIELDRFGNELPSHVVRRISTGEEMYFGDYMECEAYRLGTLFLSDAFVTVSRLARDVSEVDYEDR